MHSIVNPHDKYFKEIFSKKDKMSDFTNNALKIYVNFLN
jgi:hypothetical protein